LKIQKLDTEKCQAFVILITGNLFSPLIVLNPHQNAGNKVPILSVNVINPHKSAKYRALKTQKQSTTALQGFLCFYYLYEPINETCLIEIN